MLQRHKQRDLNARAHNARMSDADRHDLAITGSAPAPEQTPDTPPEGSEAPKDEGNPKSDAEGGDGDAGGSGVDGDGDVD